MLQFILGITVTLLVVAAALMAHTLTLTANESGFGGYLPFAYLTLAPVVSFLAGRVSKD